MNKNNSTTTKAYPNISYNYTDSCLYRLPCGYCKILEKRCLMDYNDITYKICDPPYNLNQVTCKMEES